MDFFAHQEQAQRRTTLLVGYFLIAIVAIVAAVYLAVLSGAQLANDGHLDWWNPPVFAMVSVSVLIVILVGSLWQTAQLASGGHVVAEMLGGQLVSSGTDDFKLRRLLNVVEEMAIAAGTVVPPVYVLPNEPAINAFAAGFSPNDAVIAVSRGALEQLPREELQGVIAHEFSHILRGDMRLNIRLMGLLHGILLISLIGMIAFRFSSEVLRYTSSSSDSDDKKGGNPILAIALAALVAGILIYIVGYIGVFFGNLIKSAVSRQREFLADASSVQFTRNPQGLAGALMRIGATAAGSRLVSPYADEAAHSFFADGMRQHFLGLLATHPPLAERITRILPSFDGRFVTKVDQETESHSVASQAVGFAPLAQSEQPVVMAEVVSHVGAPQPVHLDYAGAVRQADWGELSAWLNDPYSAAAVVFSLLLSDDRATSQRQLQSLRELVRGDLVDTLDRVRPLIAPLDRFRRVVLVTTVVTPLRQMSREQYERFARALQALINADGQIDRFEQLIWQLLTRHLGEHFQSRSPARANRYADDVIRASIAIVLGDLARVGHESNDEVLVAYQKAAQIVWPQGGPAMPHDIDQRVGGADSLVAALGRLVDVVPNMKRLIVDACAESIATDGRATPAETELLRVVCAVLGCPLPPVVRDVR